MEIYLLVSRTEREETHKEDAKVFTSFQDASLAFERLKMDFVKDFEDREADFIVESTDSDLWIIGRGHKVIPPDADILEGNSIFEGHPNSISYFGIDTYADGLCSASLLKFEV